MGCYWKEKITIMINPKYTKAISELAKTGKTKTTIKLVKDRIDNRYLLSHIIKKGLSDIGINIDIKIKKSKIYANEKLGYQDAFEFIFSR